MEKYEINKYLNLFEQKINDIYQVLKIEQLKEEVKDLELRTYETNFWDDQENAKKIISDLNSKRLNVSLYEELEVKFNELKLLDELTLSDEEAGVILEEEIIEFEKKLSEAEVKVILNEKYDSFDCILELHPGAGGTESMDWASMLYRMYLRYCQLKGFKTKVLDYLPGEEAGIKSVTIQVSGKYAYGYLKSEIGVHRLVRLSPFDSNQRRHTSFASCHVSPLVEDDNEIVINEDEIRVDYFRSSGAGGQSVNTTDSAVRITHLPTNIVVTCQNERSQIQNKVTCMNILKSKLLELEYEKKQEEINSMNKNQMRIDFGSQIRSYVFHPYNLVKDHRTNFEVGNVLAVMNGEIDDFIVSYLKKYASKEA